MSRLSIRFSATALLFLSACGDAGQTPEQGAEGPPPFVAAAVADPGREAQRADDAKRHPQEIMSFVGVKPGDKVLELIPGEGYWTRLLGKIVGPQGHVYAVWPQQYARYSEPKVAMLRELAANPAYPNVTVQILPTPVLSAPEPLDVVFTSQNYHDYPAEFMGNNDPAVLNDAAFKMLKPGGTYIVLDHKAAPGTGLDQTRELHRIDPELVKQQAAKAGFEFVGSTDILHRDGDQYDLKVFDPKVRGNTDKFALKFRKPA
jgi:predicted methyltransferase